MALRDRRAITRPDFEVTPAMLDQVWERLRRRRFTFDRAIFDGATPLVSRLLARGVARYVFGPDAEAERAIRDDDVIQAAARLASGATTPEALLGRVPSRTERLAGTP